MRYLGNVLAFLVLAPGAAMAQAPVQVKVQAKDQMAVPADYRRWVFLTSSLDLNYDTASAPDHHMLDNVFVYPPAYQAFLKTGTWPDKTILVKENRMAESAGTLSQRGQFQVGVMNLEIHIKDEARFPGKWAFFVSADGRAPGKLMPQTANCYSCHQDHGAVDTTFVQFYPTLLSLAKEKGTISADYLKNDAPK
ncbi:MAG TPA: cytochrome P460 family protein [Rhizomicrobium sp.]|nr:cytochrome P460 family protein [Rhizomicrobium sp.]